MFKRDLMGALCIACIVVPVVPLARIATAAQHDLGPLQSIATTPEQLADAITAIGAGATPEQAVLEQTNPVRKSAAFQEEFFETLFGRDFDEEEAFYYLEPVHGGVFDGDEGMPFEVVGMTLVGDVFTVSIDMIHEADLGALTASEQSDLGAAGVERVWGLECIVSTAIAEVRVIGGLVFGHQGGVPVWRFLPAIDPEDQFYQDAINSNTTQTASPGTPQMPNDPTEVDPDCIAGCNSDYDLCIDLANIQYAGCLAVASAAYVATLAGCVATVLIPGVGFFGSLGCILAVTAVYVGAVVACDVQRATANASCRAIRTQCLISCGWIIA